MPETAVRGSFSAMTLTKKEIQQALNLPNFDSLAAYKKMAPLGRPVQRDTAVSGNPRVGSVLALLYNWQNEPHLVLTRRRDDLSTHPGQISFPGGRKEDGEPLQETALRETQEEIGIVPDDVAVLGQLHSLYIPPSDFEVHPFVGWYVPEKRPCFQPQPTEVAEILEIPLRHFFNPDIRKEETWLVRGIPRQIPYFDVNGYKVWGATAMMISELVERLRHL